MALDVTIFASFPQPEILQDWTACERVPLGGSETAALRLASALMKRGAHTQVISDLNELSDHTCDVFISLRDFTAFHDQVFPGRINYLWCQDDADQPSVSALGNPDVAARVYGGCTRVVMLSHYQELQWIQRLHLPVEKIFRTTNGVPRSLFSVDPAALAARPHRAYYASTPYRGLALLTAAWPQVKQQVPDAELHIFSSMKVYRQQEQADYVRIYEALQQMPDVHYHGSVGQKQLREAAQQSRVLAYPCIFPETSCIAAMEAMTAGAVVAATSLGALPETAWLNPLVAPYGDQWLQVWTNEVVRLFTDNEYYVNIAARNLMISASYDWDYVAGRWMKQFYHDLTQL